MSKKVVTLGEIMMRLSTPNYKRFVQTDSFDINYGGGEANVAAALSNYGINASFVSKVPDNALGQAAINQLRRYGVDTKFVARGGDRLGIYFLEPGASMRASQVIYDRAGSSITEAEVNEFDFDDIFSSADWFHTSGITPAISDKSTALTLAALKAAKAKGITTSFDLNFRKKLWSTDKAREVLIQLCPYIDVCIGPDATLGFHKADTNVDLDNLQIANYENIFSQLKAKYGFKYIASGLRDSHSASDNSISAVIYDGTTLHHTKKYDVHIVDRVGTGDSFASGLIYGLITGLSAAQATEFGVAASALKHTIPGDMNHATVAEIEALVKGDGSGKIQR